MRLKVSFLLQKDVFEIPAVDVGKLVMVKVTHDGAGVGSGWLLDKVVVKETEDANQQYVFSREMYVSVIFMSLQT